LIAPDELINAFNSYSDRWISPAICALTGNRKSTAVRVSASVTE
jgi:hypothetical protein